MVIKGISMPFGCYFFWDRNSNGANIFAFFMSWGESQPTLVVILWIFWFFNVMIPLASFYTFWTFLVSFISEYFNQGSWYSLGSSQPTLGLMAAHQFGISRSFVILRLEVKLPPCFQSKKMSQTVKPKICIYEYVLKVCIFSWNIL